MGSTGSGGRTASLLVVLALAVSLGACAKPKTAGKPVTDGPAAGEPTVSNGHVSYCRAYADQMAGRELQREYNSMEGRFRGSESRVFQDFARMDAQKNYRRIYQNCVRNRTADRKKDNAKPK